MKRYDEALPIYDRAIELDPSDVENYDYRGEVWQLKGNNDRALADYSMAIRINPLYVSAYYQRGYIYEALGKLDLAKSDYSAALSLPTKTPGYNERNGKWAQENAQARLNALAKGDTDKK